MTAQDDTATANGTTYPSIETEVDEDLEEAVLEGELVETYLTDSKQNETAARLLQIGVAVFAVALLLVAAFIHRSRQISQDRNVDSIATAAATDFRPESFDIETGGSDDLPQNSIEVFDAASEEIDDMGCWAPNNFNQRSLASGTSLGDSTYTYTEAESVKTSKISNTSSQ